MPSVYTDSQTLALKVLCAIIPTIVTLATCLRLWIKGRDKWWVDDLLATLGVLVMIEQLAVLWSLSIYEPPTLAVFYAVVLSSQTMIWLARGSILASVIRIIPGGSLRVMALYVSGLFVVFYVVIIAQFVWVCEMNIEPNSSGVPRCVNKTQVAILQMTMAMISDALLIFLPLRTLRELKNQPRLRRRLQSIFAASALTTCASIVSAAFNLTNIGFGYIVVVEIENWVSLIVCNFAVLASALLKLTSKYTSTSPDGSIYSSSGRRVGAVLPRQSLINFSLARTGHDGASEEERSGVVELSKLDLTADLPLGDVPTMARTRAKSPSPPPPTIFDGQTVDLGV